MADVLARIVERKKREVAARLGSGRQVDAVPTSRSLTTALRQPGARFIMEIKPRSPSGHVARHQPGETLDAYQPVADAISILTDEGDFGGSLDLLRDLRKHYGGPILAKDFIVDTRQVGEARAAGADAVLCMLSVLDDGAARAVMDEAERLGMDVLVEVHDQLELRRALSLGAKLVGVNNRDLKTLETDLSTSEKLAPLVPREVTLVSESGIRGRRDVQRLAPLVDAFLVGSHLMAADEIALAARSLVHGAVKICGLADVGDVDLSARSGATHAGFILVSGTPRAVDRGQARTLAMAAREFGLKTVGVFRDRPAAEVARIAESLDLDAVQLHGAETGKQVADLRSRMGAAREIWALCGVGEKNADPPRPGIDRSLFDTRLGERSGGTGRSFDWTLLRDRSDLGTSFLAGGIAPDNALAASKVGSFGLDVGSGVEAQPRVKDAAKMADLFAALRPCARGDAA